MTNLLKAEINRWFSRRLWWALLLAAVAASLLVLLGAGLAYQPQTPAEIAQAERDYAEAQRQSEQEQKECLEAGEPVDECAWVPERSDFVFEPPSYSMLVNSGALSATLIGGLAALVIAASFMGAEFKSGSLATWLTYVPRRVPVFVSKAVVSVLGGTLLGVLLQGLTQLGMLGYAWRWLGAAGLHGADAQWGVVGRGVVVTAAAGLVGFCLATLFGNTIAPLATMLGLTMTQWVGGVFTLLVGTGSWVRAMPDNNLNAFVNGHFETTFMLRGPSGEEVGQVLRIGLGEASLYLGCLLIVVVASALWSFTRREVR